MLFLPPPSWPRNVLNICKLSLTYPRSRSSCLPWPFFHCVQISSKASIIIWLSPSIAGYFAGFVNSTRVSKGLSSLCIYHLSGPTTVLNTYLTVNKYLLTVKIVFLFLIPTDVWISLLTNNSTAYCIEIRATWALIPPLQLLLVVVIRKSRYYFSSIWDYFQTKNFWQTP